MLIIKVDKGIERALKEFKNKTRKTKLNIELRDRKFFKKKSIKDRERKLKAIYVEKLNKIEE